MAIQFRKWLIQPRLWRFVCFASTVTGLASYALSSSFNHLFGHWNLFKILLYGVFSSIICFAILFAQLWHHWQQNSATTLTCKAHLSLLILTATTVYSFFYDRAVNKKPDAYSLISCAAFAVMSLSLSRQTHFGFEVDLLYFFLGFLILQFMKIELLLGIVGVCFSYCLIILRSSLDASHTEALFHIQNHSQSLPDSFNSYDAAVISVINLKLVLVACSEAVAGNDLIMIELLIEKLREMVSVSGEPLQRLGACMLEALVARLKATGSSIYKTSILKFSEGEAPPTQSDVLRSYMHIAYEICPYLKFGYMTANGAIAEAMKDEDSFHIIDFQIGEGVQWTNLIQALADRPGGPPHIRITGIDDFLSAYLREGEMQVGQRLSKLAEDFRVPFEFHALDFPCSNVEINNIVVRPGEAVAVNFGFILHEAPDESLSTESENHRDRLLRLVKSLSPKVVTLVEHEYNTNTTAFVPRFLETLDYHLAAFESIDVVLPRENKERINFEQQLLARVIVNIIACEGVERVERHELHEKWKSRFEMAGFAPYPFSSSVNGTIRKMLENYSDKYRLEERDEALYLGWMNRDLFVSSAWK